MTEHTRQLPWFAHHRYSNQRLGWFVQAGRLFFAPRDGLFYFDKGARQGNLTRIVRWSRG